METTISPAPPPARALFKSMLQGSGLYMAATLGVRLASFILVPVVTRHLTTADYGALDLLEQVGIIISVLLGLNFSAGLGFFYFETGAVKRQVVGTTLAGSLLFGTLAGLVGWIFAEPLSRTVFHSPDYVIYLRMVFVSMPLSFLLEAGLGWLRVENRAGLYAGAVMFRVIGVIVCTLTLVLAYHFKIGGVLGANIGAISITALAVASVALRSYGPAFDSALFKRMARFALPLCLSACALFVIHFGDRFIVPRYRSLADLGVYAVAYKFGMLLSPIQAAFESYWSAQLFDIVKRPDARAVFSRTFTYWMLVLSACGLGLLVATPPMLRLMMPPAYFRALTLVPIVLIAYYVRALGDFFRHLLIATGFPSYDAACNWITAGFSLAGYFVLIPRFGITGAAVATLITFLIAGVISIVWSYKVWPYEVDVVRVSKLFVVTGGLCWVHLALPTSSLGTDIIRGTLLLLAFPILLFLWRFPSAAEKDLIRSSIARLMPSHV